MSEIVYPPPYNTPERVAQAVYGERNWYRNQTPDHSNEYRLRAFAELTGLPVSQVREIAQYHVDCWGF